MIQHEPQSGKSMKPLDKVFASIQFVADDVYVCVDDCPSTCLNPILFYISLSTFLLKLQFLLG